MGFYASYFVAITISQTLSGCSDPQSEKSNFETEPSIYGKWQGSQFDIDNNDVWVDITKSPYDADFTFTIQFNEDGTYEGTAGKTIYEGHICKTNNTCLDVRDGKTIKGVNFVGLKEVGDPVELVRKYSEEGADAALPVSLFHYNEITIKDIKQYLNKNNIKVRL